MDFSIIFIIPNIPVAQRITATLSKMGFEHPVYTRSTQEAVSLALDLLPKGVRLIVSHGLTREYLQRDVPVPIIELPFSGLDALVTTQKALEHPGRIIHLGTPSLYHYIQRSLEYLGADKSRIAFYNLTMDLPLQRQTQDMIDAGYDVFIGGYSMAEYVRQAGKIGLEFDGDELIIESTILNAHTLVETIAQREARNELDNAILHSTSDGIIAIDQERCIFNINPAAVQIFEKLADALLGRKLEDVMTECGVVSTDAQSGQRSSSKEATVVLHELPVVVRGAKMGSVVSIKAVSEIRELEYRVRKDLILKGLIAKKHFHDIVGKSSAILQAKERAEIYAKYDSTVLICGETGTGKEVFAQSIHNASPRKNEPFVAINCATLPENLIESELFGYVKGAFTGATNEGKQGLFEIAGKGSIFLDEISELPISVQSKLLRAIQEGDIIRVGGNKILHVDVRVICSSNKDLRQLIREGKFKDDLYYRLCVLELNLPPLRERPEDIEALSYSLLQQYNARHHKSIRHISQDVLETLKGRSFLGNVRELANVMERMVILSDRDILNMAVLERCDLQSPVKMPEPGGSLNMHDAQMDLILSALEQCGGNKSAAAKMLGINYTTLWRKMKTYQLQ